MSVYDSVENYATELSMPLEQAKIRLEYFKKLTKEMNQSRKCPKCQQHTLEVENGEWESGVRDWVYCTNDKIEKTDTDGTTFFDGCDFTDEVEKKYLFAFHHDFDAVLMMASGLDIHDEEAVLNHIGETWSEFVEKSTKELSIS